jgi:septal ring factor EnvC (AmiA/AmiB activator)
METGELLGMIADHAKPWEAVGVGMGAAGGVKLLGAISTAEWQAVFNAISTGILLVGGALVLVYQQTAKARRSERLADEEARKASLLTKVEELSTELKAAATERETLRESLKASAAERESLRERCDRLSENLIELTEKLPGVLCKHPVDGKSRCAGEDA